MAELRSTSFAQANFTLEYRFFFSPLLLALSA